MCSPTRDVLDRRRARTLRFCSANRVCPSGRLLLILLRDGTSSSFCHRRGRYAWQERRRPVVRRSSSSSQSAAEENDDWSRAARAFSLTSTSNKVMPGRSLNRPILETRTGTTATCPTPRRSARSSAPGRASRRPSSVRPPS